MQIASLPESTCVMLLENDDPDHSIAYIFWWFINLLKLYNAKSIHFLEGQ